MGKMKRLLQVHITDKCNLCCKHCYQEGIDYNFFLEINDYKILIDQFKDIALATNCDSRVLNITGGEPLIVPNIMEYIDIAIDSGVEKINFLTNGILLNKEVLLEIKKRKIIEVQVSLEGAKKTNDYIRGEGSFAKILSSIRLANNLGVYIKVSYTLNNLNCEDVSEAIKEVYEAGAKMIWFDRMIPFKGNTIPEMSAEQFITTMLILKNEQKKYQNTNFKVLTKRALQFLFADEIKECYRCSGIVRSFTCMPDGTIYPCRRMPIKLGNFKEENLLEIYKSKFSQSIMKFIVSYPDECHNCGFKESCRGGLKCKVFANTGFLETGDRHCMLREFFNVENNNKEI